MELLRQAPRCCDHCGSTESLAEFYRTYGQKHLQKTITADLDGVRQLLRTLGKEAAGANASQFIDPSLVQELEKEGLFQTRTR